MRYVRWPSRRGSVHVFVTYTRVDQVMLTRCGRRLIGGELLESLPLNARSCESCLRFAAHDEQPSLAETDPVIP